MILIYYILIINIMAFVAYGLDKYKARHGKWRIPESTLILFAIIGGSIGAIVGMKFFCHKTRKAKFFIGVPVILVVQLVLAGSLYYYF